MDKTMRIAMWSGPRNLSTAMMRSFGSRADTVCVDEPFYAAYLNLTGLDHPMRDEIISAHETDPDKVVRYLMEGEAEAPIFYQKQMTHHMVDGVPRDWFGKVKHVFLIRHPARVLASYARKMEAIDLDGIGFPLQAELFEEARQVSEQTPVVIDSDDILADPEGKLAKLCAAIGITFDPAMLSWTAGPKPEDGVWAPHWYDAVWKSTSFGPSPSALPELPEDLARICDAAMPLYEQLAAYKL